jgi:uncharacterized repeat protein (TIGR02543 family)
VNDGSTVTPPAVPVRAGHTFRNWYTNAATTTVFNFGTPITDDLTLYAGWTLGNPDEPVVAVRFWRNDGSGNLHHVAFVQEGSTIAAPTIPVRSGWSFGGWYNNAEATGTALVFPLTVTGETNVYAQWR